MSAETIGTNNFGGRSEYNQTLEGRLIECQIITDVFDTILETSFSSSGATSCVAECGAEDLYVSRSFGFIEGDEVSGWAWPLTERYFELTYSRNETNGVAHETYVISHNTFVRQIGASSSGLRSTFTIEYYGTNRYAATSIIEEPNFTDPEQPNMVIRDTTPYDQVVPFDELVGLSNAVDAGVNEQSLVSMLSRTIE